MSIVGTRPEAIKMAPLIRFLKETEQVESILTLTAQHREMLDQVLSLFELEAHYDLDIMLQNQTLIHITASALKGLDRVLALEKPDLVLIQGDTTTTLQALLLLTTRSLLARRSWAAHRRQVCPLSRRN